MSKHSEGPWVAWFNRDADGHITEAGIDSKDRHAGIAEFKVLVENVEYEDAQADALIEADTHLIAAAPELLEALKKLKAFAELHTEAGHPDYSRVCLNAAAAIAKAKGPP